MDNKTNVADAACHPEVLRGISESNGQRLRDSSGRHRSPRNDIVWLLCALLLITDGQRTSAQDAPTTAPVAAAGVLNVRAFGAAGDGKQLDSPAINKAIE